MSSIKALRQYVCYFLTSAILASLLLQPVSSYGVNEQLWLHIIHPEEISYHFKILPAKDFGNILKPPLRSIPMLAADPWEACSKNLDNGGRFRGRVVLVVRGECSFLTKALNVQEHGAVAVIVANNDPQDIDTWIDMSEDGTGRVNEVKIAAFYLLGKDGQKIKEALDRTTHGVGLINVPSNVSDVSAITQPKWDLWYN